MRTRFATAGSLYALISCVDEEKRRKDKLEASQVANHPLVDVGKRHASVATVHGDVEEDPVERDELLKVVGVHELGDVLPYFAGKGGHWWWWQRRRQRRGIEKYNAFFPF